MIYGSSPFDLHNIPLWGLSGPLWRVSWPARDAMLPEQAVFCEEAHAERTAQAKSFVLSGQINFATQDQVKPVFTWMF